MFEFLTREWQGTPYWLWGLILIGAVVEMVLGRSKHEDTRSIVDVIRKGLAIAVARLPVVGHPLILILRKLYVAPPTVQSPKEKKMLDS